jgi:hypothetical protein
LRDEPNQTIRRRRRFKADRVKLDSFAGLASGVLH